MTPTSCGRCGTELAPDALACPACRALVHSESLKQLAANADAAARAGDLETSRMHWTAALQLLPVESERHTAVQQRMARLVPTTEHTSGDSAPPIVPQPWWKRGAAGVVTLGLISFSKIKFLLLGLTKASTLLSMVAFFGVYWSTHGWPLALGFVTAIYIHEMGHVAMLHQLGIEASAPMFIPGVGALVMLKQHVSDPLTDAKIGLAGPVWGFGAALAAAGIYEATDARIWLALAQLTAFVNLFNLTPIWQLDGSRGVHALARGERWALVAAIAIALLLTEQRLLLIVGGVAVWRAVEAKTGPGDRRVLATFVALVVALAWLARGVG